MEDNKPGLAALGWTKPGERPSPRSSRRPPGPPGGRRASSSSTGASCASTTGRASTWRWRRAACGTWRPAPPSCPRSATGWRSPTGAPSWPASSGSCPARAACPGRGSGRRAAEQVVAANVDRVILMMGLDEDYNLRRLERYLALAYAAGITPVWRSTRPIWPPTWPPSRPPSWRWRPRCRWWPPRSRRPAARRRCFPHLTPRDDGGGARLVGGGQVDPAQPAGRAGRAADRRRARLRPPRPPHDQPRPAVRAARRRSADRHPRAARDPALGGRRRPGHRLRRRRGPRRRLPLRRLPPRRRARLRRAGGAGHRRAGALTLGELPQAAGRAARQPRAPRPRSGR